MNTLLRKLLMGLLLSAGLGAAALPPGVAFQVRYEYSDDGRLVTRTVNDVRQHLVYDKLGQLVAVVGDDRRCFERYVYDPAGNMLEKEVAGAVTRFAYDAANQLVRRTDPDGKVTTFDYDAAGRMVREGDLTYRYGYLDKVVEVRKNGKSVATYDYTVDGQVASVRRGNEVETYAWDGLAMVGRDGVSYLNEPAVTGGNPVAAGGQVYLNDMLGSTVGALTDGFYVPVPMTAFGESADPSAFYTGKPQVPHLGYAFLMRNYRADHGKWLTADPMGYPDGWNQMAYCGNEVTEECDLFGTLIVRLLDKNNNNCVVTDAASLQVAGYELQGGKFSASGASISINDTTHEVTVSIRIGIYVQSGVCHDDAMPVGSIVSFKPHESSISDSHLVNPFYEVIYGHEFGHATAYLTDTIPIFETLLASMNVDDGTRTTEAVSLLANSILTDAWNMTLSENLTQANFFTYGAFNARWRQIAPFDGFERWQKVFE